MQKDSAYYYFLFVTTKSLVVIFHTQKDLLDFHWTITLFLYTHCFETCICCFFQPFGAFTYFLQFPHYFACYVFHFSGYKLIWENITVCSTECIGRSVNYFWSGNDSFAPASNLVYSTLIIVTYFIMFMTPPFFPHTDYSQAVVSFATFLEPAPCFVCVNKEPIFKKTLIGNGVQPYLKMFRCKDLLLISLIFGMQPYSNLYCFQSH